MTAERYPDDIGKLATLEDLAAVLTRESRTYFHPRGCVPIGRLATDSVLDIRKALGHGQVLAAAAGFMLTSVMSLVKCAEAEGSVTPRGRGRVAVIAHGEGGALLAPVIAALRPQRLNVALARIHEETTLTSPWDRHGLHGRASGLPVVMVDDVVDTGHNFSLLGEVAEEMGCYVVGAVALVDKSDGQAAQMLAEKLDVELTTFLTVRGEGASQELAPVRSE
jgi:adenine/guanine phosphoribosyltransferase-like PRPP-binding protein